MTYAVRWSENDGTESAGSIDVGRGGVELYIERRAGVGHGPALVVVERDGRCVRISSLEGLGALHELAEHVACEGEKAVA
jgi:hypothetical protein